MGLLSRMSTMFKAKVSHALDQAENPEETLDYSYQKQLELLQNVRRGLADVVSSKKRLEMQAAQLEQNAGKLEEEAKQALTMQREDLATAALQRKQAIQSQLDGLHSQLASLEQQQAKLTDTERALTTKVESFRPQKEVIKAQYSAAQAQVKIGEATSGLSEQFADVGLAVQRAKDRTEQMQARASAINELVDAGTLQDALDPDASQDDIQKQLNKLSADQNVTAELERLKAQTAGGGGS